MQKWGVKCWQLVMAPVLDLNLRLLWAHLVVRVKVKVTGGDFGTVWGRSQGHVW